MGIRCKEAKDLLAKPIGMREMNLIFGVTDELGLSREVIEVPLFPKGLGAVSRMSNGKFEITIPVETELAKWLPTLREKLIELSVPG